MSQKVRITVLVENTAQGPGMLAEHGLSVTGPIPRGTEFEETGGPFFLDKDCSQPDPLIDDQSMKTCQGTSEPREETMKIAVTASGPAWDAAVDPRFGRCPYFVLVDTDRGDFEALENKNAMLGGGAGIQAAQMIAQKGPAVLLTGNCGPNAFRTLSAAGIQVVVGCSGTVRNAIQQFQAGLLQPAAEPNVTSHFGTGGEADQVQAPSSTEGSSQPTDGPWGGRPGRGMGRGGGMGRGRGSGRGRGRGRNT